MRLIPEKLFQSQFLSRLLRGFLAPFLASLLPILSACGLLDGGSSAGANANPVPVPIPKHLPAPVPLPTELRTQLVQMQVQLQMDYVKEVFGNTGNWPSDKDCDGALWAGVARAAGLPVDVSLALQPDGRPTRRPCKDCGPTESAATTSTDMQLGTILGLFSARDLDSLTRLAKYADDHALVVGSPATDVSRTLMKPGTRALLAQAIASLGGPNSDWRFIPQLYAPPQQDYQLHLELLSIYLETQLKGRLEAYPEAVLSQEAQLNPKDSLVQALARNNLEAASMLLDPNWTCPGYVRGPATAAIVHKLLILQILLAGP